MLTSFGVCYKMGDISMVLPRPFQSDDVYDTLELALVHGLQTLSLDDRTSMVDVHGCGAASIHPHSARAATYGGVAEMAD